MNPSPPPRTPPRSSALAITVVAIVSAAILALGILFFGPLGAFLSSYAPVGEGWALFEPLANIAFWPIIAFNLGVGILVRRAAQRHSRVRSDLRQWLISTLVTLLLTLLCLGVIMWLMI